MAISLTESARNRVQEFMHRRGHGIGIRLGVKKTGCSGYAYVVDYADGIGEEDVVFESDGVKVVVAPENLTFLDGTVVDFVREGLNQSFQFRNPNVKDECGCGESFTI